ncbi:hypothetical protein [Kitasatospora sp. NPDC094011]|uniref:hypothetical protein n=1 Tax=Kitasatospora sp. NPDC094011 TaxID=3364090 RepID=UPI0038231AB1
MKKRWNKRWLTHFGVSLGTGFVAGLGAASFCGITAGLGCMIMAGAVIGTVVGTPAHVGADGFLGHRPSDREIAGYALKSAGGGGYSGGFRSVAKTSPFGLMMKGIKRLWR